MLQILRALFGGSSFQAQFCSEPAEAGTTNETQFVAHVDRLKADNAGVPLTILIDGDSLEYGNAIARRTAVVHGKAWPRLRLRSCRSK